jgi:hypothetical protein
MCALNLQAGDLEDRAGRVQTIDVLLRAMQRRLGAVKAAMAADAARAQQQHALVDQAEAAAAAASAGGAQSVRDAHSGAPPQQKQAGSNAPPPGSLHQSVESDGVLVAGAADAAPLFHRQMLAEVAAGVQQQQVGHAGG